MENASDRDDPMFRLYLLTTPHVRTQEDVPHKTEQKLLDDLHDMDRDGWEIAHVFASGTHILMRRKDPTPKGDKPKKPEQKENSR